MSRDQTGLSLCMSVTLLAGQMAGLGVLSLPSSMIDTGLTSHLSYHLDESMLRSGRVSVDNLLHNQHNICRPEAGSVLDDG